MIKFWQQKIGVYPKRIQMRDMTQKWASCSKNKIITFNRLLLSMPKDFIDYIICHEFLHLKIPNHGKLFFSFLGNYLPDWQKRLKATAKFLIYSNSDKVFKG
jgi:predicted metal-dependent hydrolase